MAEMYDWDTYFREDKSRRNTKNPSFSSSLLDEIYRSIDGGDEKFGEFKLQKQKVAKEPSIKSGSAVEDDEIASFRRACLVDKWMEIKGNKKVTMGRRGHSSLSEFDRKLARDNEPFSSGSSSSDSSFGWYSEAESAKLKPSCFGPLNGPKHVKTNVSSRCAVKQQNEFYFFDDHHQTNKTDHGGLIRSKTRALKIYTSLKKLKQPISPGGRLTTFFNAFFTNAHVKKPKVSGSENRTQTQTKRRSKSTSESTSSSTTSFSRSCLSKNPSRSSDELNNGTRRTVRFLDHESSRPRGKKDMCNEHDFEKRVPTFPLARTEKQFFNKFLTKYNDKKFDLDDDEDDMASDSSSDLFELDHLSIFKNEEYSKELPVYETTHLGTNRAIASGLFR